MRTAKIKINKKEYLLCFSTRVIRACSERYGKIENVNEALSSGTEVKMMDESFWLLATMMDAGARYAKLNDIETPAPLSADDLYDLCGMDDLLRMKAKIFETVENGNERKIETEMEEEKNAETTQRNSKLSGTSGMA